MNMIHQIKVFKDRKKVLVNFRDRFDISLTDDQIATIVRWVDSGAPLGDPKDLPAPKQWPLEETWLLSKQFGEPDFVTPWHVPTMPPIASEPVTIPEDVSCDSCGFTWDPNRGGPQP